MEIDSSDKMFHIDESLEEVYVSGSGNRVLLSKGVQKLTVDGKGNVVLSEGDVQEVCVTGRKVDVSLPEANPQELFVAGQKAELVLNSMPEEHSFSGIRDKICLPRDEIPKCQDTLEDAEKIESGKTSKFSILSTYLVFTPFFRRLHENKKELVNDGIL